MDVRQQPFSSRRKAEIHKQILNKTWRRWQAMAPHPIPLPCALALPSPSHQDATTPSPCWAPHFMTQERIMFSNPTPSKLRFSPAATMGDEKLSALTKPLPCASILQPAAFPQVVAFDLVTVKTDARKLHSRNGYEQGFFCTEWVQQNWHFHACEQLTFWGMDTHKARGKSQMRATYIPDA